MQSTPDIYVSGVFRLTERTYGFSPYRSALLNPFDKQEDVCIIASLFHLQFPEQFYCLYQF